MGCPHTREMSCLYAYKIFRPESLDRLKLIMK